MPNFSKKVDIFAKGLCAKISTFCEKIYTFREIVSPPLPNAIEDPAQEGGWVCGCVGWVGR